MTKCKDFGGISGNFSTAILISLRVLQAPLYICGLRVSVGGRLNLPRKGDFLNLETFLDKPDYQA